MGFDRAGALKAERDEVVALCGTLSAEEWAAPSRCEGWTVHDVVAHMGAAVHGTFTPWVIKMMASKNIERGNDADAAKRADRSSEKVLREYTKWSSRFCAVQRALQHQPLKALPVRLGEFGTYPAWMLTNAITFDTAVHLRYDIATAIGKTVPASDAPRMMGTLEWMMAGLPNMSGDRLGWVDQPIEIRLAGPGGSSYYVTPGKKLTVTQAAPADAVAATIEATAAEFPIWATRREAWRNHDVKLHGDEAVATRFLDDMQVV